MRTVFASLRLRAREHSRIPRGQSAVTFVQRFGDALTLNVHFHSLVLDGIYASKPFEPPRFHPLPPPAARLALRVPRALRLPVAKP